MSAQPIGPAPEPAHASASAHAALPVPFDLPARMQMLDSLHASLSALPLSWEEACLAEDVFSQRKALEREQWLHARCAQALSVLFPSWGSRRRGDPQPPQWHPKSWWSGASIESLEQRANGDVELTLSSYVGGGETDTLHGFVLKNEWLQAPDMGAVLRAHVQAECTRKQAQDNAQAVARARAQLAQAQNQLQRLGLPQGGANV